jgi:hypothetical protein
MKKRLFTISLTLAIVLMFIAAVPALAQQPGSFFTKGKINSISNCDLSGEFLSGNINGAFTMTYQANAALVTQASTLHGTVNAGPYVLKMKGKIEPLQYEDVGPCSLPKLTINGNWTLIEGAQGQGEFQAWAVFIPTTEADPEGPGHINQVLFSSFTISGQWHP